MNSGSLHERITRALAFMLRHQPEEFDLELDRFGWGDLEDVIYALQERLGSSLEEDDLLEAIEASDRPRYEVLEGRIRALYGHSFPIDPGEPTEPPDELFIGVGSRDASRADERGLRSGRRAFLHLARTEDEAREAGRRVAKDYAIVTVYAGEAYDEGIDFYDRGALFLADEIPVDFLEVGEVQHDGFERDAGRRSRGRRTADGPRGPRRRGRGRARRDFEQDEPERSEPERSEPERSEPERSEPERSEPERSEPERSEPERSEPEREVRRRRAPEPEPDREAEVTSEAPAPIGGFGAGLKGSSRRGSAARKDRVEDEPTAEDPANDAPVDGDQVASDPEPEVRQADVPRREPETSGPPPSGFGAGLD